LRRKVTAKKVTAKKVTAKKVTAKKATARKATAKKPTQLEDGRAAHWPKRYCPVDLEAAWAALRVPEDDVCVLDVLERDATSLLETGTRRVEKVDDWAAPAVHAERLLPENRQLLDRERAGDRPLQGADPWDVERLPKIYAEVPYECSPSVSPSRLRGPFPDPRDWVQLPITLPPLHHLAVVPLGPG
jgi:hypothetical protein